MKSYDYYGFTTSDGATICLECSRNLSEEETERLHFHPIFADSEWDYYPSCDICGDLLDYVNLTEYGREYEQIPI
jgi:hypothetical protein